MCIESNPTQRATNASFYAADDMINFISFHTNLSIQSLHEPITSIIRSRINA